MNYLLNPSQQGVYYASQTAEAGRNYTISCLFTLPTTISIDRLARAIEQAVMAHPSLLDVLGVDDQGEPYLVTPDSIHYEQPIIDAEDIESLMSQFAQPMSLDGGPLTDIYLVRTPSAYYLCLNILHLLIDGASMQAFLADISAAYAGAPIAPEPIDAAQINLSWQAKHNSAQYEDDRQWYEQLVGGVESTSLPQSNQYEPSEEHYTHLYFTPNVSPAQLSALAKSLGVGKSVPYTAAFALTLQAFTGEEDIHYATFYHGRTPEQMRTATMLVRTLPMVHHIGQMQSVEQLLHQTHDLLHQLRHRDTVGFGEICAMSGMNADVSFIYQGAITHSVLHLDGEDYHWRYLSTPEPGMRLSVQVSECDGALQLKITYPTHMYTEAWIGELAQTYATILEQLCDVKNLSDIHPCSEIQLRQLAAMARPHEQGQQAWAGETVVSVFRRTAATYGSHYALRLNEQRWTYAQLDALTDHLAATIIEKCRVLKTDQHLPVVSVLVPRNEWMVLASLGALKAGCAYQPLDCSYPKERLNYMLHDAEAQVLITTRQLRDLVDYQGEVVLTEDWDYNDTPLAQQPQPVKPLRPENLFIMLYTSGSTGVPKGVMLTHENILSYAHYCIRTMTYGPDSCTAAYASYGFDANMMDLYPTLLSGGELTIIPENIRLDLEAIGQLVERHRVTHMVMTTQVAQQFGMTYDRIGRLQHLIMGGEKMVSMNLPTGYIMHNMYGPTECTVAVTDKPVEKNEPNIPIGRATDDVQLYVVNRWMQRLPIGAPGELIVVGKQVGLGYLNQPEKTAQAFIEFNGQHAYRTGDVVRFRHDGDLEFVGRRDGQVKIRGFRIELKEVESVIREYTGIEDVTVQAFDYPEGGKYIVAYIVANTPIDISALEQFIAAQKPPYMVPAYTMQLERIPLNVNQKVDKKALPKPELKPEKQEISTDAAPLNRLEEQLHALVAECIHQSDFSLTTPLIYAGLTSISAMKVAARLYKQYGVKLDVKQLVKTYSLQSIENDVLTVWMNGAEPSVAPQQIQALDRVPLTGAQQGVYLDWEANRDALQYNVPMALRLVQADAQRLESALQQVLDAHPALQVHLAQENGETVMVSAHQTVRLEQMAVNHVYTKEELSQQLRPFDLFLGPLYRFCLYTDPEGAWLLIDIHHIVYDGLSTSVFLRDLNRAYQGEPLAEEAYSLLTYAVDNQQLVQGENYQAAQDYFDQLIDDSEPTRYPESEHIASSTEGVGHTRVEIPREGIEKACQQLGITVNSYMATIVGETLHRISREEKVLFMTISNGRNDVRMMDTVGMFVQTMVVTANQHKGSIEAIMRTMHEQLQDTLSRDYYPFSAIASRHHIAPQIIYAYQDGVVEATCTLGDQQATICPLDIETAKAPLSIQIQGSDRMFTIEAEYDRTIYSEEDMHALCAALGTLAEQCTDTHQLMQSVALTSREEQTSILAQSYGGDLAYDRQRTLPQWVNHYAQEQPSQIAVVDYCSELSYSELNHRTNLLAAILRQHGVRKDSMVGIMLPRVKEFLVSVLSIHKAGGAYVPLDSEYPNDRLEYMLENSEAPVLITTHSLMEQKSREGHFQVPKVLFIEDIDWSATAAAIDYAELDGLAYMIYTSGSTGRPKGVMLEHRNLMAFAGWRTRSYFEFASGHQFLCHPSFCFDASICDLLLPLFAGATVHILHDDLRKDLDGIAHYITSHHIDGTAMPTQLGMALLNSTDLPLRYIEMGGEKLVQTTTRQVQRVNAYGPTEFTVCSSYHLVRDDETDIPIGRPAPNTWSVIVDAEGHLLPFGMAGELCLMGGQIARGYWHLDEKTKEVFTPSTFASSQRMYHTGDLARYNQQGKLIYLGRIDHQVKLRGFRIEMGEIEAQMVAFDDVTASIALVQEIGGAKHLVGYYTATKEIDTAAMKAHLLKSLTSYMVPDALVQMQAFPLTPNGKIDRKKLPVPQLERSVEYVAPKNELENQLCQIFSQVTGAEQVGIKDDFFTIGGTSLLAIKAVIDITNLGKKIVYGDLFRLKTPEALAAHIDPSLRIEEEQDLYQRFDDYDYSAIEQLLRQNHLPDTQMQTRPLGTVLLAGATGFMGIHVLDYLMRETDSQVYCLVRSRGSYTGASRLQTMMVYYLPDTHSHLLGQRIHVIEEDITNPQLATTLQACPIDTIINCAAMVKHYVVGKEMEQVNIDGVAHLIDLAQTKQARLIHISTYSTAGYVPTQYRLPYSEQQLYVGQCTDNEYIRTKFLSERLVLQAIADGRIDGKVMRVGNLMARAEDGEFQINLHSNAFLNNLRSLSALGCITSEMMASPIEMSPIDCVAAAICLLATTPQQMVLFHPYNAYPVSRALLVDELKEMGHPITIVTPEFFQQTLQDAMQDEQRSDDMQGIIHYSTHIRDGLYPLMADNFYTTQVLLWLQFRWPMTTEQYVRKLLKGLDGLAFF